MVVKIQAARASMDGTITLQLVGETGSMPEDPATLEKLGLLANLSDMMTALYRNDGQQHPYEDAAGHRFMASVAGIAPDGTLTLLHEDGSTHSYLFKEVKHIINEVVL